MNEPAWSAIKRILCASSDGMDASDKQHCRLRLQKVQMYLFADTDAFSLSW